MSFFPQIIQGPIGIYDKLAGQLYEGHSLRLENLQKLSLIHISQAAQTQTQDPNAAGQTQPTDPNAAGQAPVSYTHLDVYKRQAMILSMIFQTASSTPRAAGDARFRAATVCHRWIRHCVSGILRM